MKSLQRGVICERESAVSNILIEEELATEMSAAIAVEGNKKREEWLK